MLVHPCERFGVLPEPGGLLDQDSAFIRALSIVDMSRGGDPR